MVITKLSKQGKYKRIIELDGTYAFFLYEKEVRRLGLAEGQSLNDQLIEEIYQLILFPRAKEKALSLLQYRNRTQCELKKHLLHNGYPENICDQVILFLKEYRLLDDHAYVVSYIELNSRKKSRLQMQHELSLKGIGKELFSNVWEEQADDIEERSLREQLEKRIRIKGAIKQENYPKFFAYFARKGYSSSMIGRLLREYQAEEEE